LHGIAEMAATLRRNKGAFGLVLANGGWMTKEAAGVYSTTAPKSFTPAEPAAKAKTQVEVAIVSGDAVLETFTVTHGKDGPDRGIIFARLPDGRRVIANNADAATLATLREDASPVGRKVSVTAKDETATFVFA
jgi:acetyl-CoA C-acetyltransferase